jgi:hypothetical protein
MQLGGEVRWREVAEAHADPLVGVVAQALAAARDLTPLLFYAVSSIWYVAPPGSFLSTKKRGVNAQDQAAVVLIEQAAASWRQSLDSKAFDYRRGAVVEKLAAILVRERLPANRVFTERKVKFSDGSQTTPFDVLAAPVGTTWEGLECKAGWALTDRQADELSWAAERADALGESLLVIVASAAARASLLKAIRPQLRSPHLVYFVAADTFRTLAKPAPRYTLVA